MQQEEIERLRNAFDYNPETGLFTRKHTRGKFLEGTVIIPQRNTSRSWYPYIKWTHIDKKEKQIPLHRLAWLITHGNIKDNFVIDHINGNIDDNRLINLREVTKATNSRNRRIAKNNKYGHQGIHLITRENDTFWKAEIIYNYDNIYIGVYNTMHEAIIARKAAEVVLGFHINHGRQK